MEKNNKILSRGCVNIQSDAADAHFCKIDEGSKLHVYDWMKNSPTPVPITELVEVRFKNTRKAYYRNVNFLSLKAGDIVAVEASPGHDIGVITLIGELVYEQMRRNGLDPKTEQKKVYRKAKSTDIEKWKEAIDLEHPTMIRTRKIAVDLRLNMKIGDVEFQGDKTKAIFYYIADERVDFRELIKILADNFKVRIEMKQIGARQEAGRIGGIGSCGRELCCSSWMVNFVSVSTLSAKAQELSLNPKKLAGQCIKLKCCMNYEFDAYKDQRKDFPDPSVALKMETGYANHVKTDVHRRLMWFVVPQQNNEPVTFIPLAVERVKELQEMNKQGILIKKLKSDDDEVKAPIVTNPEDDINRFRKQNNKPRPQNNRNQQNPNRPQQNNRNEGRNDNRPNRGPQNNNDRNRPNDNNRRDPKIDNASSANEQTVNPNRDQNRPQNPNRDQNRNQQNPNRNPNQQNRDRNRNFNRGNNPNQRPNNPNQETPPPTNNNESV